MLPLVASLVGILAHSSLGMTSDGRVFPTGLTGVNLEPEIKPRTKQVLSQTVSSRNAFRTHVHRKVCIQSASTESHLKHAVSFLSPGYVDLWGSLLEITLRCVFQTFALSQCANCSWLHYSVLKEHAAQTTIAINATNPARENHGTRTHCIPAELPCKNHATRRPSLCPKFHSQFQAGQEKIPRPPARGTSGRNQSRVISIDSTTREPSMTSIVRLDTPMS